MCPFLTICFCIDVTTKKPDAQKLLSCGDFRALFVFVTALKLGRFLSPKFPTNLIVRPAIEKGLLYNQVIDTYVM